MPVNASLAGNPRRTTALIAAVASCYAVSLRAQTAVKPGDDFFAYANAAWLQTTPIPEGKQRWGARDEINEQNRRRVATLLDDARSALPGSAARKVADFRAAWLDETAIEARGRAPLQPLLDSIDAIADKEALVRFVARSMRADVDPLNWGVYRSSSLLGLSVEPSIHGERTYVAFLVQGGLGLPDREQYLSAEPRMQELRGKYQDYVSSTLSFGGFANAARRAASVVALETAIAKSHATPEQSANDHNADSVWTPADFVRRAPGIDWHEFLAMAGLGSQESIVAWQPSAVAGVAELIASQPLETWKDYLRFHAVDDYAEVLPHAVAEQASAMRAAAGQPRIARVQRALDATQSAMSDVIGRMYADRYFPADQKARVQRIVANVTAEFIKRVQNATWMTPDTKALAVQKVKSLYVGIGYPERWQDYSDVTIDARDAVGNVRQVAAHDYRRALARLGQAVNPQEWWIAPQTAGAILVFQQNAYDFSAALLQPPKYDAAASDAASYGAIGAIIGHDVSHFVDVLGADYGLNGAMRHWWTAADASRFQALADPLVAQFSSYRPFADAAVDGKLTQTENIADLAGLVSAFDAYRATLGERATDTTYVKQQDREFFIAFAQSWRVKLSDGAMRAQLATDHAPERYRVFTVRNLDAWYDAFDVRPGQQLYLEPKDRVKIW